MGLLVIIGICVLFIVIPKLKEQYICSQKEKALEFFLQKNDLSDLEHIKKLLTSLSKSPRIEKLKTRCVYCRKNTLYYFLFKEERGFVCLNPECKKYKVYRYSNKK